jgi:hypothetical protein
MASFFFVHFSLNPRTGQWENVLKMNDTWNGIAVTRCRHEEKSALAGRQAEGLPRRSKKKAPRVSP